MSLIPVLGAVGEQKTKPTQHGAKELRSAGLSPDVIVCRSAQELLDSTRRKIAAFCHVDAANVVGVHDVTNIYHVPLLLQSQHLGDTVRRILHIDSGAPDLSMWKVWAASLPPCPAASARRRSPLLRPRAWPPAWTASRRR